MRISDWSSDVCSSDLRVGLLASTLGLRDVAGGVGPDLRTKLFAEDDLRVFRPRETVFRCRCTDRRAADVLKVLGEKVADTGRASCRERVCSYGETSVAAGSFKK